MKTIAIIQARMGSTRLKDKGLADLHGRPLTARVIERIKQCKNIDAIVLATPETEEDKKLKQLAETESVYYFAGPENDVLKRFVLCAEAFKADIIVRVCGDSPLISPLEVDRLLEKQKNSGADYTANSFNGKPVIQTGLGIAVEIFSVSALKKADKLCKKAFPREHVTMFFYTHPEIFKTNFFEISDFLKKPDLRLTIDNEQDLKTISLIFKELSGKNKMISLEEVIVFLDSRKEIYSEMKKNNLLNQKKLER